MTPVHRSLAADVLAFDLREEMQIAWYIRPPGWYIRAIVSAPVRETCFLMPADVSGV